MDDELFGVGGDTSGSERGMVTSPIAMQLFSTILGSRAQPVDLVAARCAAKGGAAWSAEVLSRRGGMFTTLEQWTAWKESAKADFDSTDMRSQNPVALDAFLEYAAAIAGALACERVLISRMPRTEIRRMLRVIGFGLTGEWRTVFDRAAVHLAELPDENSHYVV